MKRKGWFYLLLILLLSAFMPIAAQAAWKNAKRGRIYTIKKKPGYLTGWNVIDGEKYYFNPSNGVMATGWKKIKVGKNVYRYYFGNDGKVRTGAQKIENETYFFNERGRMQTGFVTINGKKYYADAKKGAFLHSQWLDLSTGSYYFLADGTMAVNQVIQGNYLNAQGRASGIRTREGFVREDKKLYYYENGKRVSGWVTINGESYYFKPSMRTGWFTAGSASYYADTTGAVQKSDWIGKKYVNRKGQMVTGWEKINGKKYYFADNGDYTSGKKKIDGKVYRFDKNGVLLTNFWYSNKKNTYYYDADGVRVSGFQKINGKTYYFTKGGKLKKKWFTVDGKLYYGHKKKGWLFMSKWFTKENGRYYAYGDGSLATGIVTISGNLYGFSSSGKMYSGGLQKIKGKTYYFRNDGTAVVKKWKKINGNYYYFDKKGRMARNTVVDGYQVDANGVRGAKMNDGWVTKNGNTYYVKKGKYLTGLRTINGNRYYFNENGVMQTGIQEVKGKKYYFYPGGTMATDITLAVGTKEYTINSEGVVTAETNIKVSGSSTGANIAKFALKYVGNRYVYGGTSLTNGADCSGFVMTVFANFGIKLLRVANDQMYGPGSGLIASGYKRAVVVSANSMQPGDLLFSGSGGYASHVAIYIGDGKVVHASNSQPYPAGGIKISPYNYNTVIRIVRYWS